MSSQIQRILSNESGAWASDQGSSKAMSFTINIPAAVDFDRSYVVLRTTLAVGANPTVAGCIRQIGLGYQQQVGGGFQYPIAYKACSFLRDTQFTSETRGTLMATQYNNIAQNSLNQFTTSDGEARTKNAFGEGWQDMLSFFGNNGVSNNGQYGLGNYQSSFVRTLRYGAVTSSYMPYVDLVVPCSDLMGSLGTQVLPMDRLGRCQLTLATEAVVPLVSVYARTAASNWPAYAYTRDDANTITVAKDVRDLSSDCPFYVGQCMTTNGGVNFRITSITDAGAIQLGTSADTVGDGTIVELAIDAAETVSWSISEASLVMTTVATAKIPRSLQLDYVSLVDVPWGPSATQSLANMFSLPVGTIAVFLANPYDVAAAAQRLVSVTDPLTRCRFALDNVDLTNRDLILPYPPNSVYMDRLSAMLQANTGRLKNLLNYEYTSIASAAWSGVATTASQLQLTAQCSRVYDGSVMHLFCIVVRSIVV